MPGFWLRVLRSLSVLDGASFIYLLFHSIYSKRIMGNAEAMQQIEPMVVEQQAIDWIVEHGKKKTKKVSFKDYMNAPSS